MIFYFAKTEDARRKDGESTKLQTHVLYAEISKAYTGNTSKKTCSPSFFYYKYLKKFLSCGLNASLHLKV